MHRRHALPLALLVALALVLAPAAAGAAQDDTPAADPAANKELVRRFYDAFNRQDLAALDAFVAADVVDHDPAPGQAPGLAGVKAALGTNRTGFPDGQYVIEDLVAEGDTVAVRTTFRGTHTGALGTLPPTGNVVNIKAIDVWRVADGRLVELWPRLDELGVLQQLGLLPGTPPETVPAASPAVASAAPGATDLRANKALAQRFHADIFDAGNLAAADELLAPGFVWHVQVASGPEGVKQFAQAMRAAFPDLRIAADDVRAEGDRVAIRWTLTGTHGGDFFGVPASGRPVSSPGVDIYRIENGRIVEIWTVGDDLGILAQIGAIPGGGSDAGATTAAP